MYFIETGYGDQYDDPTKDTIDNLLSELKTMDDEHSSFWLVDEDENVIQLDKDLTVVFDFANPRVNKTVKIDSLDVARKIFVRLLNGEIKEICDEWFLS